MNKVFEGIAVQGRAVLTDGQCAAEQVMRDSRTVRQEIDDRIACALNAAETLNRIKLHVPAVILDLTMKQRTEMGIAVHPDGKPYPY